MNEVTLDHIRKACEWAIKARGNRRPTPIDGQKRYYDQSVWDCGTACCVWGAANIIAGNADCNDVEDAWEYEGEIHNEIASLMRLHSRNVPERILEILDKQNELDP